MGHRRLYSTSSMFESEHDQNLNHMHAVQPYMHSASNTAVAGTSENTSYLYPVDPMSVDGVHLASYWNLAPRTNGYSSPSLNNEAPYCQPDGSGPSHDPYMHRSAAGTFSTVPEHYAHHSSSSSYDRQKFHGVEGFVDPTMNNGRGPCKRKSSGIPGVNERGSTSRYYGAGSSSDLSMASDQLQEKPFIVSQQHWEHNTSTPCYRGDSFPFVGEGSSRNVRSRSALDLESNPARAPLQINSSHHHYSNSHLIDHCNSVDLTGQSSGWEWHHIRASPASRINALDPSGLVHPTNHSLAGGSTTNAPTPMEIDEYHDDFSSSRNPVVPQSFQGPAVPPGCGFRSGYLQRCTPDFRASSSCFHLGHVASSDDGLQLVAENNTPRYPRPLPSIGWRNNARTRISNEIYPSHFDEGLNLNRSNLYGSRNMLDQHRDMRLDIDNMSYEELLALEERIGNVNTGLSEDLILKSLTETIYCSSDQIQEEERCVICLEEYKNKDNVGMLRRCGHDYHVGCIKQWLSMKNSCPICKTSALADNMEQ